MPRPVRPELATDLVCGWTASVGGTHALVPDGCVDALWTSQGAVWFCGPETHAWTFTMPPSVRAVGMRFRPGVIGGALGLDVAEMRDRRLDPGEVRRVCAQAEELGDMLRSPGAFGPEVPAPPGADEQARLLAFLGRQP